MPGLHVRRGCGESGGVFPAAYTTRSRRPADDKTLLLAVQGKSAPEVVQWQIVVLGTWGVEFSPIIFDAVES